MKKVTHVVALIVVTGAAFCVTPAGQALVHQYPVLAPIAAGLATLAALYFNPQKQ